MTKGRRIAIGIAAVVALAISARLGLRMIVVAVASHALEDRGFSCAPIDITFALDLSSVELGPTRCAASEGPVRSLRVLGGATAYLDEQRRVTRVHARGLELTTSAEPPREMIEALVETGEVTPRLQRSLAEIPALAAREDLPRLEVDRILVQRANRYLTLRDVVVDRDGDAVAIRVAVIEPPALGRNRLRFAGRMVDVRARATAAEVRVAGRIEVEATLGRRDFEEAIPFRLRASALDTLEPIFRAHVELSPRLQELRDLAQRRAAARAEVADPEDPRLRIHELAESLRRSAESMRRQGRPED